MKIILLGPPMSGKGTQTVRLSDKFNAEWISTGNILRQQISDKTALGVEAKKYMDKGLLVPDDLIVEFVNNYFDNMGDNLSFILDGYPRTIMQAESLDQYLKSKNIEIDFVIQLIVDRNILISRLTGRMTCESCGATYNLVGGKIDELSKCDNCGNRLSKREDDKLDTLINRLKVYDKMTKPLVKYYKDKSKLITINGNKSPDDVFDSIIKVIGNKDDIN